MSIHYDKKCFRDFRSEGRSTISPQGRRWQEMIVDKLNLDKPVDQGKKSKGHWYRVWGELEDGSAEFEGVI